MQEEREKEVLCPVCGEPVGPAPEICPECKTPHHWDCWQYGGGCATYACPRKVKPRTEKAEITIPDKIPFPNLKAGTFLGVFHVRFPTGVAAFFFEFMAIYYYMIYRFSPYGLYPTYACILCLFMTLVWAGLTSEVYNFDIAGSRISKSIYFLDRELFEWGVCSLSSVQRIDYKTPEGSGGFKRTLTAYINDGSFIDLTPAYEIAGPDNVLIEDLLDKLRSGTTLPVPREQQLKIKKL